MKPFLNDDFLLKNATSQRLYHEYAEPLPIIDYHNHLPPHQIAEDKRFDNLTQAWLYGDHYKWRAMRANGIDEQYCTGNASDRDKFSKWAETVPYTLRNPLYHWTHLELQRYFGIDRILNPSSSKRIYEDCSAMLQTPEYSVRNLLRKKNVKVICTTDDPADTLEYHQKIQGDNFEIKILPAYRPDKAMKTDDAMAFNAYVNTLENISNISISSFPDYLDALKQRHDFFETMGCSVSDHGLEYMYADDYIDAEVANIFTKLRSGKEISPEKAAKFKSAMLYTFAVWDWEKGWVQQYHLGALRNTNTRKLKELGVDTGWDSIGNFPQAIALAKFLDRLDRNNRLAKTIMYNLNPADNEMMAAMTGNFNDGSMAGKIQWGSGWWFLDQKDGIIKQLNALSNIGLLSRFVGMLTDSRSFLSFPRHEYFRRILCNLFGEDIEAGELPGDIQWTGKIIQDICYYNAESYFNWKGSIQPAQRQTV